MQNTHTQQLLAMYRGALKFLECPVGRAKHTQQLLTVCQNANKPLECQFGEVYNLSSNLHNRQAGGPASVRPFSRFATTFFTSESVEDVVGRRLCLARFHLRSAPRRCLHSCSVSPSTRSQL